MTEMDIKSYLQAQEYMQKEKRKLSTQHKNREKRQAIPKQISEHKMMPLQ